MLEMLIADYVEELRIAAQLKEHTKEIRYDFLRKKVEKMIEDGLAHGRFLEEKIKEKGGSLPPPPTITQRGGILRDKLSRNLLAKQILCDQYIEQANRLVDENEELAKVLRKMAETQKEHQSLLGEVLMKTNP